MKLVIFGLSVSSSWGNGHATLWRGLIRALGRRGHRVVFYERDVPYYADNRDLSDLPGGDLRLYGDWEAAVPGMRAELSDADVALVTSYCPDGIAATALALDSPARLRVFYDLDTPVTLDRLEAGEDVPYLGPGGLRDFDLVLSYTGGRALEKLGSLLGARRVAPLYGSVDPSVHHGVPPVEAYRADLSYFGTYAADRQDGVERFLVEPARRLSQKRFLIGGAQYPADFPWADNIFFVRHMPPPEHSAFYSSSGLTLNVTRRAMAEYGYCPSGRLFEAAACATPVLSDWWEGLDEFFTPGQEILAAHTTDDALEALARDPQEMARIGLAARERSLDEHSAERRASEMEAALDAALGAIPDAAPAATGSSRLQEA